jgi:hypothetical protein
MNHYYDDDYKPSNREKSMTPKRGATYCATYCNGCDRALVPDGSRCHVCGWHKGKKKLKP